MAELKLLTKHQGEKDTHKLAHYKSVGGYTAIKKALGMKPEDIVTEVKNSGLRGSGISYWNEMVVYSKDG